MIQVKQLVRRDRNRKKGQQLTRQIHLPLNQKRRYGTPTPHLLQSDSIFRICIRFLFDWCMIQVKQLVRSDRNRKKGHTETLTIHQKRYNGTPTPYLLQSDSIFRICIRFRFDWCMMTAKQVVRRHRKQKKWHRQNKQNHLPMQEKTPYDSSRRFPVDPNTLPRSASNLALIDVW